MCWLALLGLLYLYRAVQCRAELDFMQKAHYFFMIYLSSCLFFLLFCYSTFFYIYIYIFVFFFFYSSICSELLFVCLSFCFMYFFYLFVNNSDGLFIPGYFVKCDGDVSCSSFFNFVPEKS